MIAPLYSYGLIPRRCFYCKKLTRERVTHQMSKLVGRSELDVLSLGKYPMHNSCHNEFCPELECSEWRQRFGALKPPKSSARILSYPEEECGLCGMAYMRDEEHRCHRLVEVKDESISSAEMDLLIELTEPIG